MRARPHKRSKTTPQGRGTTLRVGTAPLQVPEHLQNRLCEILPEGVTATKWGARAVHKAFIVMARVSGPGIAEGETASWITQSMKLGARVHALDELAARLTGLPLHQDHIPAA